MFSMTTEGEPEPKFSVFFIVNNKTKNVTKYVVLQSLTPNVSTCVLFE